MEIAVHIASQVATVRTVTITNIFSEAQDTANGVPVRKFGKKRALND
jgi:hypothetical protein